MCNEINVDDFDNDSILDISSKDFFIVCCYCGDLIKRKKNDKLTISHGICSNCFPYVENIYIEDENKRREIRNGI
jgi:hypothetical protein